MKVTAASINHSNYSKSRALSFGDACGYVPTNYLYYDAMSDMAKRGYIVQGIDNFDAFARLHRDVNLSLEQLVNSKQGEWIEIVRNNSYYDSKNAPKYAVHKWNMTKENFVNFMVRFWEKNKTNKFLDEKASITNFLVNSEGLKKPGFFQMFSAKYADYADKSTLLAEFIKKFIKTGQYRLK